MRQTGLSLEEIGAILNKKGVTGIEADYEELEASGFAMAKELAAVGLPIHSVYKRFDWSHHPEAEDYEEVLNRLQSGGIHYMLVIPGFVDVPEDMPLTMEHAFSPEFTAKKEAARKNMLPNVKKLCDAAPKYDVHITMEDYDDLSAAFSTKEELAWFFERVPNLGCAFDTGNFFYSCQEAMEAFELLKNRITYVHCKDRSFGQLYPNQLLFTKGTAGDGNREKTDIRLLLPKEDTKARLDGKPMFSAPVGGGVIPMTEILKKLKAQGYDGTYAIEHFGSVNHMEWMLQSAEYLTSF